MSSESDRRKEPYIRHLPPIGERDFGPLITKLSESLARKHERESHPSVRLKDYSEMTPEQIAAREAWFDRHGRLGDPEHDARIQAVIDAVLGGLRANGGRVKTGRDEDVDFEYWEEVPLRPD